MRLVASAAIISGFLASVPATAEPETPVRAWAASHGCTHSHQLKPARRGVRAILRSPKRLNRHRGARAWHYVSCASDRLTARLTRSYLNKLKAWRRSYRGYWQIQVDRQPGVHNRLSGLRWCESTGNYRATNGSHWGAYQYADSTWARAQWWVPRRYRTWRASLASPDHQDAVTGRFYPSHAGEWACSS